MRVPQVAIHVPADCSSGTAQPPPGDLMSPPVVKTPGSRVSATLEKEADATVENGATGLWF
jgi:hypothetical protein